MTDEFSIDELGPLGDGVRLGERGRIYVERTLPGDVVRAKMRRGPSAVLRADLTEVIAASPHRTSAPCPHYDVCGGCALQHATEAFYRDWKIAIVRDALEKRGLTPARWSAPVFLPGGSRRRVTFAAVKKNNAVTLGYFRRRSHHVTDITACLVADPAIMALRAKLVPPLISILQEGKAADIFIQVVNAHCEMVITGPVGKKGKPDLQVYEGVAELAHAAKISRISWRPREHLEPEVMLEISPVIAKFGELEVTLPPLAFLQPTKAGEDALVFAILELLPQTGKFADLFAGCGTFSGPMLKRGSVDAFEINSITSRALEKSMSGWPLRVTQRDLFRNPLRAEEADRYDVIVFDPPRSGAYDQVRVLAAAKTPLLIGVSCNPATFARDARVLTDGGYSLERVKIVDQFIWSHHVELVASFAKRP